MRPHHLIGLVLGLAFVVAGCAAERHVREADVAAATGQPEVALRHYRQALATRPQLADDAMFQAKLKQTHRRTLCNEGDALIRQGTWELAVAKYQEAVDLDPGFRRAQQGLAAARRGLAQHLYEQATQHADAGRLDQAIELLRRALDADDRHEAARQALKTVMAERDRRRAEAAALFEQAAVLAGERRWQAAAAGFNQALAVDPSYAAARTAMHEAKAKVIKAESGCRRGATLLRDRSLDGAIAALEAAVTAWPFHPRAEGLLQQARQRQAEGAALYAQAAALAGEQRWQAAVTGYNRALAVDATHVAARAGLWQAKAKLSESESGCRRGAELLNGKSLDEAITVLESAAATWPFNAKAEALLKQARTRRGEVDALLARAETLRAAGQWDEALAATADARALFRNHAATGVMTATINAQATGAWVDRGEALLARGALTEAESAFQKARRYKPANLAAARGLAEVSLARGEVHAKAGRWGQALLHYLAAADHLPAHQRYQAKIAGARAQIMDDLTVDVLLDVRAAPGASHADTATVASAVRSALTRRTPAHVNVRSTGLGVAGPGHQYDALVTLERLNVEQRLVRTEGHTYAYTAYRHVANCEIAPLRAKLHLARRALRQARRECERSCDTCGGRGSIACSACGGAGHHGCDHCGASGRIVIKATRQTCPRCGGGRRGATSCAACRGSGRVYYREPRQPEAQDGVRGKGRRGARGAASQGPRRNHRACPHCHGRGRRTTECSQCRGAGTIIIAASDNACDHCGGKGRRGCGTCSGRKRMSCSTCGGQGHGSDGALRRRREHEQHVSQLEIRLGLLPAQVRQAYRTSWPYEVRYYRKTGSLAAQLTIRRRPEGVAIGGQRLDQDFDCEDSTIDGANTGIGLHGDGLDLPSDDQIRRRLVDGAAGEAASRVLAAVLNDQRARMQARIAVHVAGGNAADALEALVAAAVLLESYDRQVGTAQLSALRRAAGAD